MPLEPPPDYVAFVDRRLPELRARVSREVGGARPAAEELLSQVLTEMAGRWALLLLLTRHLRRPNLLDRYLGRTVRVRAERWRKEQIHPVEVTVWDPDATSGRARPVLTPVSVALRRAPFLDSTVRDQFAAVAEASIAWAHAYRARRRRHQILRGVLVGLLFLVLSVLRRRSGR